MWENYKYIFCSFSPEITFVFQAQCFIDMYENYTVPELIPILGEEDAHVRFTFNWNHTSHAGGLKSRERGGQKSIYSFEWIKGPQKYLFY